MAYCRVARISQRGFFFLSLIQPQTTWSEFSLVLNWIKANSERFSVQNQVIAKKRKRKVLKCPDTRFYFSSHELWGGTIFVFRAKIHLKTAKNMLICILFRTMGWGAVAPFAPPPSYATDGIYFTFHRNYLFINLTKQLLSKTLLRGYIFLLRHAVVQYLHKRFPNELHLFYVVHSLVLQQPHFVGEWSLEAK